MEEKKKRTRSKKVEEVTPDSGAVTGVDGNKRGRKPRGGKLIEKPPEQQVSNTPVSNVILHLKCSLSDIHEYDSQMNKMLLDPLKYNPDIPPDIITYNENSGQVFTTLYESISPIQDLTEKNGHKLSPSSYVCSICKTDEYSRIQSKFDCEDTDDADMKEINAKLKELKIQLYKNTLAEDKKSACFWCTYDYSNVSCRIPTCVIDDMVHGYGSFCRPECAVAHLFRENIDDSTKFERYQLLNKIYGPVYGYKKNIKPAPCPYYLLDKYYGNLTIQEYRKLLNSEHLMLVIDKPFTRILPELHEDNDETIANVYGINKQTTSVSGVYKVKRQSEKPQGQSKNSIIMSKFGM